MEGRNGGMDRYEMSGWMNGCENRWMDGRMDSWMGGMG